MFAALGIAHNELVRCRDIARVFSTRSNELPVIASINRMLRGTRTDGWNAKRATALPSRGKCWSYDAAEEPIGAALHELLFRAPYPIVASWADSAEAHVATELAKRRRKNVVASPLHWVERLAAVYATLHSNGHKCIVRCRRKQCKFRDKKRTQGRSPVLLLPVPSWVPLCRLRLCGEGFLFSSRQGWYTAGLRDQRWRRASSMRWSARQPLRKMAQPNSTFSEVSYCSKV